MGALADKLSKVELPPKTRIGATRKLDLLDDEDQAWITRLHVEHGYNAPQIANILKENGYFVDPATLRSWFRERGVYRP